MYSTEIVIFASTSSAMVIGLIVGRFLRARRMRSDKAEFARLGVKISTLPPAGE